MKTNYKKFNDDYDCPTDFPIGTVIQFCRCSNNKVFLRVEIADLSPTGNCCNGCYFYSIDCPNLYCSEYKRKDHIQIIFRELDKYPIEEVDND